MGEGGTGGVFKVSLEPGGTAEGVKDFIWTSLVSDVLLFIVLCRSNRAHIPPPFF